VAITLPQSLFTETPRSRPMLRRILEESLGRSVVKDHFPLSFDFVPKELPHREEQFRQLGRMFRPLLTQGVAEHARFHGPVGTGKTATAKRFCDEMREVGRDQGRHIDSLVVNCRRRPSDGAVLLQALSHFDEGFPDRGFSITEMLESLRKHLISRKAYFILVLDEADVLLKRTKTDLVYQLTRFNEEGRTSWNVSLVLISQGDLSTHLDPASASTFKQNNAVNFAPYAAGELEDILRQRVELAFYPRTVPEEVVSLIARTAAKKGDARFAIEILAAAGGLADTDQMDAVAPEHVRRANALTYATLQQDKIRELGRGLQVVLLAVARALKKRSEIATGDLHKTYSVVCEEYGEKPRGSTQFWKYLKDLESRGLLDQRQGRTGAGNTTLVSLTEAPAAELEEFVVALLEGAEEGATP